MKKRKRTVYPKCTIVLKSKPKKRVAVEVLFDPPITRTDATGAQKLGFKVLDYIRKGMGRFNV